MYIHGDRAYIFYNMWDVLLYFGWCYQRDRVEINLNIVTVLTYACWCVALAGKGKLVLALCFLVAACVAACFQFVHINEYVFKALKGKHYVAG